MRRFLFILSIVIASLGSAYAVRGIGGPIVVRQADGSQISIIVHGDEYSRYTTTADGYQITEIDGIYYHYDPRQTKGTSGLIRAHDPAQRDPAERLLLGGRTTGRLSLPANRSQYQVRYNSASRALASQAESRAPQTVNLAERAIIVLAQFSDVKFLPEHTPETFRALLNTGPASARQYFIDNSMDIYNPTFDISRIVTLSKPVSHYGENQNDGVDIRARDMIVEACELAANAGTNFATYDCDNDGVVDNVYVIFAGTNEAEGGGTQTIWPHRWQVPVSPRLELSGKTILDYACASELRGSRGSTELSGIGTFCHEFCHVLGLPDFYDVNGGEDGFSIGLYHISLMGTGNYNNNGHTPPYLSAVERWLLGWATLQELQPDKTISLTPVNQGNMGYRISSLVSPKEFYAIESRASFKWDKPLGMSGILIYHIDMSDNLVGGYTADERWKSNSINNYSAHPCMRLVESSGALMTDPKTVNAGKMFYPGSTNNTSFSGKSYGGVDWRGNPLRVEIKNITNTWGTSQFMTVPFSGFDYVMSFSPQQRSIVVQINTTEPADRFELRCREVNSTVYETYKLATDQKSVTVVNLAPEQKYEIELLAFVGGEPPLSLSKQVCQTLPLTSRYPVISGVKARYSVGETTSFGVLNLEETPSSITFALDNAQINPESYRMSKVGQLVLSCSIVYSNGSTEKITRRITVE